MPGRTERELAQDSIDTVGQILSNYQAALHLLEVSGDAGAAPRASAPEVLRQTAAEVFTPVLDACGGVAPGLEALVEESIGAAEPGQGVPAHAMRDLVSAERQRVAATHSRLIRRRPAMLQAAERRARTAGPGHRASLAAAAGRLDELETGSHSAGALFNLLFERLRGRPDD